VADPTQNPFQVQTGRGSWAVNAGQLVARKRQLEEQQLTAKIANEELESLLSSSGDSVDINQTMAQAQLNAAKRLSALGQHQQAAQLYSSGAAMLNKGTLQNAELEKLRSEAADKDEAPTEWLETMRQRDLASAGIDQFPEGTATGDDKRRRVAELNKRLEALGVQNSGSLPTSLQEWAAINSGRTAAGQPAMPFEEFWTKENQTSKSQQEYNRYLQQGGTQSFEDWTPRFAGQTSASTQLGSKGMDNLFDLRGKAQEARGSLATVKNSIDILNQGVRAGPGVGARQYMANAMAEFFGDAPSEITANTDEYLAASGPRVLAVARALAPVTDLDLNQVKQIVGADLSNTSPTALRNVLKMISDAQSQIITDYNAQLGSLGSHYDEVAETFKPVKGIEIDFTEPARLPEGVTEEDIQVTMQEEGMTREQVLQAIAK